MRFCLLFFVCLYVHIVWCLRLTAARARAEAKRREQKFAGMVSSGACCVVCCSQSLVLDGSFVTSFCLCSSAFRSAFDPYMDLYVEQENKQLRTSFERAAAAEKWPSNVHLQNLN